MTLNGAIMQLVEMRENSMMPEMFKPYLDKVIETVSECGEPSAQPEQRWIPVSERLPEEDDYKSCIECLDGAVWYFTENGTMGHGYYYNSTKEWSTIYDLKTDGKVVAWMPLPEPYKGKEHE